VRSESPRPAAAIVVVALTLALLPGCKEEEPSGPLPGRFAAVKKDDGAVKSASRTFCEQTYPKEGEGARAFVTPPERTIPVKMAPPGSATKGWRWVNLWATWCRPCTEEMPLLGRWRDTLVKDGIDLSLELWSIDEDEAALKQWLSEKPMPGAVRWLKDEASLAPTLESFGIDKNSAIPIHLFVDAADRIRCVRVGAVHEGDFGAIKTILAGG
jgi:hypothetical protein